MRCFLILVIAFLAVHSVTEAQVTFNKRMRFGFPACTLTSLHPTDSCYYATGIVADSLWPYRTGNIFLKFTLEGEPYGIKTLTSTEKTYETWENTLSPVEGGFLLSGYTIDSTMKALLIRYDADGDTLWTREYFNTYYPEESFFRPMDFFVDTAGHAYLCNWAATLVLGNGDISVMKLDTTGEVIYHKTYGNGLREWPRTIVPNQSGGVIFGGERNNTNLVTEGYTFQSYITSLDSLGNEEWTYLSPEDSLRDNANGMVLLDDGSLIVASGVGYEESSVNDVFFEKHIFKLDPQREPEWELTFPRPVKPWALSSTRELIALSDGSGYVAAGRELENFDTPNFDYTLRGWLAKVSPGGDSVWTRLYTYLTEPSNEHDIYDLKETPDGGLILCGQSVDTSPGAIYPQQGWLLKLDEHGCLVPGCQLFDSTEEEEARPGMSLAIYPNPTTDYLNFQLRGVEGDVGRDALFRIIDAQGRVVKEFAASKRNETYIVPVWEWGAGVYFLQYFEGGEVLTNRRFIKQ